jgi:type II secretory pathway component GspD/PulD (secretin)
MYFRSFLIFCLLAGIPLLAQEKPDRVSRNEEPMSSFQAVNASIDTLLQEYEQLTGNVLIKDSSLAANALPLSISVPKPVPRSELVRIIESVLLLNNYALIPGPEPKTVKVINMNAGKNPRSEAIPLYASPAWPLRR